MSWEISDELAQDTSEIATSNAPIWILGLSFIAGFIGLATTFFYGMGGAVIGYVWGLVAFTCILIFRRRLGVLSQTTFVNQPSGLNALVSGAFLFTVVEVVAAVWPIATEISRG